MQGDISLRMRIATTRPCIQTHVDISLNKYVILITECTWFLIICNLQDNEHRILRSMLFIVLCLCYKETFWNIWKVLAPFSTNLYCARKVYWKRGIFSRVHTKTQFVEHAFNIFSTENIDFCSVYSFLCCVLYSKRYGIFEQVLHLFILIYIVHEKYYRRGKLFSEVHV